MKQLTIGGQAGQPKLTASGSAPVLSSGREVLPVLEDAPETVRPVWHHPAFIASLVASIVVIALATVLIIVSVANSGKGAVAKAHIEEVGGNLHLTWDSAAAVDLYAVTRGEVVDLSQLILQDREAWVPAALGLYSSGSCFVIRPHSDEPSRVKLDEQTLSAQHAQSVCVKDVAAE